MTTRDNNNPSAFPFTIDTEKSTVTDMGMTLRDYFAAKAMQGNLSDLKTIRAMAQDAKGMNFNDYLAKESYEAADAMLKQRNL